MATQKEIKEHYEYLKKEVNSFPLPAFTRAFNWLWYTVLRYYIFAAFITLFALMIWYNNMPAGHRADQTWSFMMDIAYTWFGIGIAGFVSFIVKRIAIKKRATELGITVEEWNSYVEEK